MNNKSHALFIFVLISLATLTRLLPHPTNFTPLIAIALLAGRQLPGRLPSIGIVAASMLAVDLPLILTQVIPQSGPDIISKILIVNTFVYGTIFGIVLISNRVQKLKNWQFTIVGTLAASLAFFLTTNFASWIAFYPHSWSTLGQCYLSAIPFFKHTWLSTVLYSGVFYLALEAFQQWHHRRALHQSAETTS